MTPRRVIAAATAVITVLVLQATVLTPLTAPLALSLPAILVAAIGVEAGASAGMSIGFSAGLLADLGSAHPAGVLAVAWLLVGLVSGLFAEPGRRSLRSVAIVTLASALAGLVVVVSLSLFDGPSVGLEPVFTQLGPTAAGDAMLALLVVPSVRGVLRALRVRAPRPRPVAAVTVSGRVATRVSSG